MAWMAIVTIAKRIPSFPATIRAMTASVAIMHGASNPSITLIKVNTLVNLRILISPRGLRHLASAVAPLERLLSAAVAADIV